MANQQVLTEWINYLQKQDPNSGTYRDALALLKKVQKDGKCNT